MYQSLHAASRWNLAMSMKQLHELSLFSPRFHAMEVFFPFASWIANFHRAWPGHSCLHSSPSCQSNACLHSSHSLWSYAKHCYFAKSSQHICSNFGGADHSMAAFAMTPHCFSGAVDRTKASSMRRSQKSGLDRTAQIQDVFESFSSSLAFS